MKFIFQVNQAPHTVAAVSALRAAKQLLDPAQDDELAAVFFYFGGVSHAAAAGWRSQGAIPEGSRVVKDPQVLQASGALPIDDDVGVGWAQVSAEHKIPLLICRSAWQRRYQQLPVHAYQLSSLTDYVLWLEKVDQVRCFGEGI